MKACVKFLETVSKQIKVYVLLRHLVARLYIKTNPVFFPNRVHLRRGHRECSQHEILRPGFARLNLPWFSTDEEIDFIIDALEFVANHGWKFMPQYIFNNETGEWHHHTNQVFKVFKEIFEAFF